MSLTPKQQKFCQCIVSGMSGKDSYLTAYNSNSTTSAYSESYNLLQRDDIKEYIETLKKPIETNIQKTAISERQKKRQWLWDMIENPSVNESDRLRAMDLLNKMDSEYIQTTHTINESKTNISGLDTDTLKQLISNKKEE